MTTIVGNNGVVEVGAQAIDELKGWSLDEQAAQIEDTKQKAANQTFKAGRKSVTGSIECHYDPADAGQTPLVVGDEVSLTLYPDDNVTGKPQITLSAVITSRGTAVQLENIVSRTYGFSASGAVVEGTVP